MCNEKDHYELLPTAHVTRHAMAARREGSKLQYGREDASIEDAEANAKEALELVQANPDIPLDVVCVQFLKSVCDGGLRHTDHLQSAS